MMPNHETCLFCQISDANIMFQNDFGMIIYDENPVTKGHCLIIPHRHVASFFEVTDKERKSMISLIELARNELQMIYQPSGFHVSFADGDVNGTPIEHLHIHVMPRYQQQTLNLDHRWGNVTSHQ